MSGSIAHVGPGLPQDLLRATGRHAGALRFEPDRPTPRADQWIESKFAPWARSIVEAWAAGAYDSLAQVLFSRVDDSAQRLYYYVCELQRRALVGGPEPLILDIAKIPRPSSLVHTEHAIRQLAERLGVSAPSLLSSVQACNEERTNAAPGSPKTKRCLLAGTPPPDLRLHAAIEQAGFTPVGPTLIETWTALGRPVVIDGSDPFAAVARQVHLDPNGARAFTDAGAALREALAQAEAAAVVLWQTEDDEAQAWHLPAQRAALAQAAVPSLVLTRRDWLACDGAAGEITAFLDGVGQ